MHPLGFQEQPSWVWGSVGLSPLAPKLTLFCGLSAGTIVTSVHDDDSKTYLTCVLNSSSVDVVGHRWMRDGKVLQEDTLPDLQMQYM